MMGRLFAYWILENTWWSNVLLVGSRRSLAHGPILTKVSDKNCRPCLRTLDDRVVCLMTALLKWEVCMKTMFSRSYVFSPLWLDVCIPSLDVGFVRFYSTTSSICARFRWFLTCFIALQHVAFSLKNLDPVQYRIPTLQLRCLSIDYCSNTIWVLLSKKQRWSCNKPQKVCYIVIWEGDVKVTSTIHFSMENIAP